MSILLLLLVAIAGGTLLLYGAMYWPANPDAIVYAAAGALLSLAGIVGLEARRDER